MVRRRDAIRLGGAAALGTAAALSGVSSASTAPEKGLGRGYYLTFCRIPTVGLATWKSIVDSFAADGLDHLVLWMGGAFRSRRYPITWQYNKGHRNVRENFAGELIRYAQRQGIRVLLGFTPYTYDGTNQYPLQRPDLKGRQANGKLARMQGIHSWGYNLDPTKADAKKFMLDYVREMYFEFYPEADGLLIESSDIDICQGGDCGDPKHYYDVEYEFVATISGEVWKHNPKADILVHPNYFVGGANGTTQPYDPRWTVMFSPWTVNTDMVGRASRSYYFDLNLISAAAPVIRDSARYARDTGFTAYFPSHEFFTYVPQHAEIGEPGIIGRQLHPFGLDVIGLDENPYADPLVTVNRVAFREYTTDPDLPDATFRARLGTAVFGAQATDQDVTDLLFLHDCFYRAKSLFSPAAQADPRVMRDNLERGLLDLDDLRAIRRGIDNLPAVAHRLATNPNRAARRLTRHAALIARNWDQASLALLNAHLRGSG